MGLKKVLRNGNEDHGVRCASCRDRSTIRVKNLSTDKRFAPTHEFYCAKAECRRALLRKNLSK